MTATCNNCHRPIAIDREQWLAAMTADDRPFGPMCGDDDHGVHTDAQRDCTSATLARQQTEIARLTAEVADLQRQLAEAAKPRWTPLGYCPPWGLPLAAVCACDDTDPLGRWLWSIYGRGDCYGYCATEAEAKAAAEKACGVEVRS